MFSRTRPDHETPEPTKFNGGERELQPMAASVDKIQLVGRGRQISPSRQYVRQRSLNVVLADGARGLRRILQSRCWRDGSDNCWERETNKYNPLCTPPTEPASVHGSFHLRFGGGKGVPSSKKISCQNSCLDGTFRCSACQMIIPKIDKDSYSMELTPHPPGSVCS